jgi:hypothetical protein
MTAALLQLAARGADRRLSRLDSLVVFQSRLAHLHGRAGMREGARKVALLASPLSWSTNRTEFLS